MSPALNGGSAIWHFKHNEAIEIRDGIIFDFYMRLSHVCMSELNIVIYNVQIILYSTVVTEGLGTRLTDSMASCLLPSFALASFPGFSSG